MDRTVSCTRTRTKPARRRDYFRRDVGTGDGIDAVDVKPPILKDLRVLRVELGEALERERTRRPELDPTKRGPGSSFSFKVLRDQVKASGDKELHGGA